MANERRQRDRQAGTAHKFVRACAGKITYPSKKHAKAIAEGHERDTGELWNHYKCPMCRGWHVGHTRWKAAS